MARPAGTKKSGTGSSVQRGEAAAVNRPQSPVIGLEAEFNVFVQDEQRRPEHVFRNPQKLVREKMIPRTGRSYHLPSGGALYFDTGVIEVATPIIEMEPRCCLRAARSLWEQIDFVRGELDAWEVANDSLVRLQGFSAHYNISAFREAGLGEAAVRQLAHLLAYIVPVPIMLLASNRLSTGVGVRPRDHRIEVTADFTPDPELMTSAVSAAVGIVLGVMSWPSYDLSQLAKQGIPVIKGFRPRRHTSRKGWLGRFDCFPANPFASDPNDPIWELTTGERVSLREIALRIANAFKHCILSVSTPATVRHIFAVYRGSARSLLDFPERPPRYDDVGRIIDWKRRSERALPRSRYERVIHRVLERRPIRVGNSLYHPERMLGWYEISFRQDGSRRRRIFTLDELAQHCRV